MLAYNTHHNALIANFALNESFLSTAQLRSSLVALAGGLGYSVNSRKASFAIVNLSTQQVGGPSSLTLPAGFAFTTSLNNKTYTFKTRETLIAYNDNNVYNFQLNGNANVAIYEGVSKTKTFISTPTSANDTYVIPVTNIDLDTVVVRVYDDFSTSNYNVYTNINNATSIDENSRIYVIKESPNGYYELNFGSGVRLGKTPSAGNKIEVIYDVVSGPEANGANSFSNGLETVNGNTVTATVVSRSTGGSLKEDIDSIRKNAPYQYAAQNRMVTAEDYSALILRNYSGVLDDIKSWGGEDNVPARYGAVYVSLNFKDGINTTVQETTKDNIRKLVKDFSIVSFDVLFADPIDTFIEVTTRFQFNPNLTSSTQSAIEQLVRSTMNNYFDENLGQFDQSFRRSNMLTLIDAVDPSVLSSRAEIKMQHRLVPVTSQTTYTIQYPAAIASPDDKDYIITSDSFLFNGKTCKLRNRLNSNIIELQDVKTGLVTLDNIGYYDANEATLNLTGFVGTIISGDYIRITALPANQSVINPIRNNVLKYDAAASLAFATLTDTV